jgi:two-component system, OmpR family, sensor histidine kinase KdpD
MVWVTALALVTALLTQVRSSLGDAHVVLGYLVVVLGASARGSRLLGFSLAVLAFACFNYFFVPPFHTFAVADPLDWWVLGAFLVTSAIATQLLSEARHQAAEAHRRAADVDRLAVVGAEALNANRAEDALTAIAGVIRVAVSVQRCEIHLAHSEHDVVLAAASGSMLPRSSNADVEDARALGLPDEARLVAWVAEHGQLAALRVDGAMRFSEGGGQHDTQTFAVPDARTLLLPLQVRGRTVGVLALQHDRAIVLDDRAHRVLAALTYYAALGAERVRLADAAQHAEALREADRLKDALLMSVSHDLRTPLTTIKALAHAIGSEGDERAVTIEQEADRLNRFVGDLLDLSRLAGGALTVTPEVNAAEDLLGVALERVSGAAGDRVINVSLDASEPLLLGRFDFTHALRVLVNLIENALKYSPAHTSIDIVAKRTGDAREFLEFTVGDRGPGVPEAERTRIFEPFYRPAGSVPDAGSLGLGLSIAKRLAEAQGGSVQVALRAGGGSLFTLRVPAADVGELDQLTLRTADSPL